MANEVDISETELLLKYEKKDGTNVVVMNMLKDHTTQDNIPVGGINSVRI